MDYDQIKLGIVVPGESRGPFFTYLASLVYKTAASGVNVFMVNPRGSDLVAVRTLGAETALKADATHILWVDSDIIMPDDAALCLLDHKLPIVAANYPMKQPDLMPVTSIGPDRVSSVGKTGLEKVSGTGMGFMLTEALIYSKMTFPWFGHRWHHSFDEKDRCVGLPEDMSDWPATFEDCYFCDRAKQCGFDVWIDHDLSLRIGHYGGCICYHQGFALT